MSKIEQLKGWVADMALLFEQNEHPEPQDYALFLQEPDLALQLIDLIDALDERQSEDDHGYYSACIFALDICVAQLQGASEAGSKVAVKVLEQLMTSLAEAIRKGLHSLGFWLPVLNGFYEVHVELSDELREAYLDIASGEGELTPEEEVSHLNAIRDLIHELSDLSIFDVTENFFAQSYAMPADFFTDLVFDLYHIEEGQDIALLMLLHPKADVRDVVVAVHEQLIDELCLSSRSLTRLKTIRNWYPSSYHEQFDRWIRLQRKKGVVFQGAVGSPVLRIKASEVDGSGAQGLFIHLRKHRKHRLCGLLFKHAIGIKDAWITPLIPAKDVARYYDEAFDDSVMLREVDLDYLSTMTGHFLALSIEQGNMPDLHLLEMEEELGLRWVPRRLDIPELMNQLAVQIDPFTEDSMQASFGRTKKWPKNKQFTESWFVENAKIDTLVNQFCSFVDGIKVCRLGDAIAAVLTEEMERHRERWLFHFLWIALWAKAKSRKNEKTWQDGFFVAHAIHIGMALGSIPIMREIAEASVLNSVETMHERRTHLSGF